MAVLHITQENFEEEVIKSQVPVLIDFWATWCNPCQMQGPIIEELAEEMTDAKICKIDVDEQAALAAQFRVMSIPTLMVVKNGEVVDKAVGLQSKEALKEMLAK